jgi:hypothetical protein
MYTTSKQEVTFFSAYVIVPQPSAHCLEDYIFIDYEGFNERMTSTAHTPRSCDFREAVMQRDGEYCVVTHYPGANCDAAHLIPKCKGEEVPSTIILCYFWLIFYPSTLIKS